MQQNRYIGLDIGGTKIACGVVAHGKVLFQIREPTVRDMGSQGILQQCQAMVTQCLAAQKKIKGIGISAAGPIQPKEGAIVTPPNLPHRGKIYVVRALQSFNLPVCFENDANCAALAEHLYGAGRKCNNMVYMTISTGIGGGLILNGQLYRGCNGNAGEVGHIIVKPNGRRCGCGSKGCLEAYCSGTALMKILHAWQQSTLANGEYKKKKMNPKDFFDAIEKRKFVTRQAWFQKVYHDFINHLALGIAAIATSFNPEKVVLGGGIGSRAHLYGQDVEQKVKAHLMLPLRKPFQIVAAKLGRTIGVIGSASLFESRE